MIITLILWCFLWTLCNSVLYLLQDEKGWKEHYLLLCTCATFCSDTASKWLRILEQIDSRRHKGWWAFSSHLDVTSNCVTGDTSVSHNLNADVRFFCFTTCRKFCFTNAETSLSAGNTNYMKPSDKTESFLRICCNGFRGILRAICAPKSTNNHSFVLPYDCCCFSSIGQVGATQNEW